MQERSVEAYHLLLLSNKIIIVDFNAVGSLNFCTSNFCVFKKVLLSLNLRNIALPNHEINCVVKVPVRSQLNLKRLISQLSQR